MASYDRLWEAIEHALRESPADFNAAMRSLADERELPSPWEIWTLIGMVRHRRRQLWVAEIVATRLGGDPEAIGGAAVPQSGLVPGLTEWEYYFHGIGCCLTHRGTGESIDVDFYGPTGEYFDIYFYINYLRSLQAPETPEARLIALHPSFDTIRLAVKTLSSAGLLTPLRESESSPLRVSEQVLEHEDLIDAFSEAWASAGREIWLAASIGDWLAAHDAALHAGDQTLVDMTSVRAVECRSMRTRELRTRWGDEGLRAEVLLAFDDADAGELPDHLELALRGPISGVTSRAVEIIQRRNRPVWCAEVFHLFGRLDGAEEAPQPHLWVECQRFLLTHDFQGAEMRRSLSRACGTAIADAALLAMEHDPTRALPLVRRALRSHIPWNRIVAAAILALIDRPWSRRELLAVLRETNDQEATAECRAALCECHDQEALQEVLAWEADNPYQTKQGRVISMREVSLRNASVFVQSRMQHYHDRVMRIRDREPGNIDEPGPSVLGRLAAWISTRVRKARGLPR